VLGNSPTQFGSAPRWRRSMDTSRVFDDVIAEGGRAWTSRNLTCWTEIQHPNIDANFISPERALGMGSFCPAKRRMSRSAAFPTSRALPRCWGSFPGGRARSVGLHPTAHSAPRAGPRYHAPGSSDPGDREPWVPKPAAYCSPMPASSGPQSLGKADGANPASSLAAMPSGELDSPPRPSPVYRTETPAVFLKALKKEIKLRGSYGTALASNIAR
jgi:hypothetical protein